MKTLLTRATFILITLFVVLFDKDGAQLGLAILATTPDWVVVTASIIGNTFWLIGVLILFGLIALLIPVFNADVATESYDKLKAKGEEIIKKVLKKRNVAYGINIVIGIFAVGSGFWFTGPAIVALNFSFLAFQNTIQKLYDADEDFVHEKKKNAKELLLEDD